MGALPDQGTFECRYKMRSTDGGGVENKTACGFSVAPSVGLFSCFLLCYWQQQCVESPLYAYVDHLLDYNTDSNEAAKQKLNSGFGVILSLSITIFLFLL